MKYIRTYEGLLDFLKKKKKVIQIPFERILINLQKFIDAECPDKIDSMIINEITLENKIDEAPLDMNNFNRDRWIKMASTKMGHGLPMPLREKPDSSIQLTRPKKNTDPDILGTIVIKLKTDDDNYISIALSYNHLEKFDMITWMSRVIKDGQFYGLIDLFPQPYNHNFVDDNTLYGKIRNYLIENDLIGPC